MSSPPVDINDAIGNRDAFVQHNIIVRNGVNNRPVQITVNINNTNNFNLISQEPTETTDTNRHRNEIQTEMNVHQINDDDDEDEEDDDESVSTDESTSADESTDEDDKARFPTPSVKQLDDTTYQLLHKTLLAQPSQRERQQQNNETLNEQQNKSKHSDRSKITVHFTFESGPMSQFQRELHCLWEKYYKYPGSPMNNVRLQIGTRSNKSLCQLFVKKKPPKNILTNTTLTADLPNPINITN